jgi:hypothetical protein
LKGSAYLSTLAFIETHFGPSGRSRVLEQLADEDRTLLSGMVVPIRWYPLAPFPRLLRAMDQTLGRGDLALVTERGSWVAINDMKTVHRVLLKFVTPQWVIEKSTRLWSNFHDTGRWESQSLGERAARATLYDLGVVDDAMCATLKGWIIGLLKLAHCQPTVTHDECRLRGASGCVYVCNWR